MKKAKNKRKRVSSNELSSSDNEISDQESTNEWSENELLNEKSGDDANDSTPTLHHEQATNGNVDTSTASNGQPPNEKLFTQQNLQQAIEAALAALGASKRNESENENGSLRIIPESDRLVGRKNYKSWRRMVELDLRSYDLIECIENESGDPEWNERKRRKMLARAQTYVNNSVSSTIKASIVMCTSAYAALKIIQTNYGENETQDAMDLYKSLLNLNFRHHYNKQRYVNQFETLVADFAERGIPLDDALQRIIFLNNIEDIEKIGSTASTFYTSMCIQPKENRTMAFVRQQFLNLVFPRSENQSHSNLKESSKKQNSFDSNAKRGQTNMFYNRNEKRRVYDSNDRTDNKRFKPNSQQQSSGTVNADSSSNSNSQQYSNPQNSYRHPVSSAPDGRYYRNNVLVIPGKKPNYSKEQSDQIHKSSPEERRKLQCSHCGQYFHRSSECKNPGPQCFRCSNFGHCGRFCPINPDKRK